MGYLLLLWAPKSRLDCARRETEFYANRPAMTCHDLPLLAEKTIKIVNKKPQTRDWLVCMPLASYGMLRVFSCSGTCNFCSLLGCIQIWNERHQSFRHVSTWSAMGPVTFNIVQKWNSKSKAHVGNIFVLSWWLKRWMSCTLGKEAHVSLEPGHPPNQEVSGTT